MKKFKLCEPATILFYPCDCVIIITDEHHREIYKRHIKNEIVGTLQSLNLPRYGEYYTNVKIFDILPLIKNNINFQLYEPERNGRYKPFEIVKNFDDSQMKGSPARIFTEVGRIELGKKFYQYTPQIRLFILLHELGHFFYKTEHKTDLFALYYYLLMGYNKSQALYALTKVLHPNQNNKQRILKLYNILKNGNEKRI